MCSASCFFSAFKQAARISFSYDSSLIMLMLGTLTTVHKIGKLNDVANFNVHDIGHDQSVCLYAFGKLFFPTSYGRPRDSVRLFSLTMLGTLRPIHIVIDVVSYVSRECLNNAFFFPFLELLVSERNLRTGPKE